MVTRNNAPKTRGRPFEHGNPGRPKGARHRATIAIETLLEGEAETLTRKAIEMALAGDTTALRLCLERLAPPRKDRMVEFELKALNGPADALAAVVATLQATANGRMTPNDAAVVIGLLDTYRRSFEATNLEARIEALEALR
jgi:hypothetical protein